MGSLGEERPFKVLVAGGSYAGLAATLNLLDLCRGNRARFSQDSNNEGPNRIPVEIKIVDERDGYYHLIGVPLALASNEYAASIWKKFEDIPALQAPEITCIQGRIDSVDCDARVARIHQGTGPERKVQEQKYDYLIACTGLRREWPSAPKSLTRDAFIAETAASVKTIEDAARGVVVIGGGAVGVEIAAELKMLRPQAPMTLIHSRQSLLSSESLPDEFSAKTLELLRQLDIDVILGARVNSTTTNTPGANASSSSPCYTVVLSDGRQLTADHVINAVSRFTPTTSYLPGKACDAEGYVLITPDLQFAGAVPNKEYHYAAGDLACWSGIKRGGAAMHQGHHAAFNIHQKMLAEQYQTATKFLELTEVPPMMALALGATAVGYFPATGLSSGDAVRSVFFQDDLGYQNEFLVLVFLGLTWLIFAQFVGTGCGWGRRPPEEEHGRIDLPKAG